MHDFFHAENIRKEPERIEGTSDSEQGYYLANTLTSDSYNIGFFYYKVNDCDVARRKVSLRTLVRSFINPKWGEFEGVLVVFDDGRHWRLSFVSDIKGESTSPRRYTYVFGDASNVYNTPVSRFSKLQETGISYKNILEAFSVEALSKDFYNDLYSWYQWALSEKSGVSFPNNPENVEDDRENINIKLIRLITRLLFVWFIKQKKLVPEDIFNVSYLEKILKNFSATSSEDGCYYNAILQNLFFATLNCAILDEDNIPRRFAEAQGNRDTRNLYRYDEMFQISKTEIVEIFAKVPFLNGGLFECLDRPKGLYTDTVEIFYDGFSRNATKNSNGNYKYRAFVPNILFFNEDEKQPGLINLLNRYNFTIEENKANDAEISLDPELLGRVFENLLAAYNPETQESARKTTGSFYTPRPIVDFMANEALKGYILNAKINGIDKEKIDTLFSEEGGADGLDDTQKQEIISTLKSVKILDPACGSGAFPMGCLLRIVDTIEKLSSDPIDKYSLKLEIIENCIYGVDIQPIAMLICKLRFFISLICEQKEIDHKHPESNFGINTLPNLETKFVAANSLIKADIRGLLLDKGILKMDEELRQKQRELLDVRKAHFMAKGRSAKKADEREDEKRRKEIQDLIVQKKRHADQKTIADCEKSLKRLKEEANLYKEEIWEEKKEYFSPDLFSGKKEEKVVRFDKNKTKRETTKKKIQEIEREIATEKEKEQTKGFEKAVEQITKWNPYDQNSVSDFLDPEWMFCMGDDKFDIVIGNPPYIQLQNNGGKLAKDYESCGYKTFARTGDIYCLFYERGVQLLRDGGHLCFITSNKWMRAGYGEKTRSFLDKETDPQMLIDFSGVKVFESATVDTNILLLSKSENRHKTLCAVTGKNDVGSVEKLGDFVNRNATTCSFSATEAWVILSPIEQSIKRKIEAAGTPLKDWDIQINYGIKTGYNEAFIITTEKRDEILANCADEGERTRTAELIRPILRGRDIKRYSYEWAGLWLINTHNGVKDRIPRIRIEDYPAVKNHLDQYWEQISTRSDKGDTPYNLRNCAYMEDFSKPKIVYPNMTTFMPFYYDEQNFITNQKCFIITGKYITFLNAFFNSSLFKFCFKENFPMLGDKGRELSKIFFDKIPVLRVSSETDEMFRNMVDDIQLKYTKSKAREIDNIIFDLYDLTDEERKTIGFIEIL